MNRMLSGRWMALAFAFLVLAAAGQARAQNYCDPGYSFKPAGSPPLTLYQVASESHIVVMEYMPWTGPSAYTIDAGMDVPALGSQFGPDGYTYDMTDCRVLGQHVAWMMYMGIDAILLDVSNVGQCIFTYTDAEDSTTGCATTRINDLARAQQVRRNIQAIYTYYYAHNVPIRIIPMMDAQDSSEWTQYGGSTETGFSRGLGFFSQLASQYPAQVVWYHARPMLGLYVGTPYAHAWYPGGPGIDWLSQTATTIAQLGLQNTFTYRFVTGFTDSQCPLWDTSQAGAQAGLHRIALAGAGRPASNPCPGAAGVPLPYLAYPIWSWIDRLSADLSTLVSTYSVDPLDGKPENLTVTQAFSGTICVGENCKYRGPQCNPVPPEGYCVNYWGASDTRPRADTTSPVLDDFMSKAQALQPKFLLLHQFNEFGHGDQGYEPTRYLTTDVEPTSSVNGAPGWGNAYIDLFATKVTQYKGALVRLSNLSTRGWVDAANPMIGGFTIAGPGPKTVMIKAKGPSLAAAGISPALPNPKLSIYHHLPGNPPPPPQLVAFNDDESATSRESTIVLTLDAGNYSAVVESADGNAGDALVQLDEQDSYGNPVSGLSTRAFVRTGNFVTIGGFAISGSKPLKVLIRGKGPSLAAAGISNPLLNPKLTLLALLWNAASQTWYWQVVAANDDWNSWPNAVADMGADAPSDSREAAMLLTLNPGIYSAILEGVDSTQGTGLVDIYMR